MGKGAKKVSTTSWPLCTLVVMYWWMLIGYNCKMAISCRRGVLPFILYAAVDCGGLPNPANGQVMANTTTFGSNAMYRCNNGYTLSGSATRNCLADARWSGTEPTCSRKYMVYSILEEHCTYCTTWFILVCSCGLWRLSQSYKWSGWHQYNHTWFNCSIQL